MEETKKSNNPVQIWFEENYEIGIGEKFKTSAYAMLQLAGNMNVKELATDSEATNKTALIKNMKNMYEEPKKNFKYEKDLSGLGKRKKYNKEGILTEVAIKGGFRGFKLIEEEEEEGVEIPVATAVGVRLVDAGK